MDPSYICALASMGYYDNLRSARDVVDHVNSPASGHYSNGPAASETMQHGCQSHSKFSLPFHPRPSGGRRRRSNDAERSGASPKRRLLVSDTRSGKKQSYTSSIVNFNIKIESEKATSMHVEHVEHCSLVVEEEPPKPLLSLAQRILSLPSELQLHIITFLPLPTIFSLRLASKAFHSLVTANESPITRYRLAHSVPKYALERYPAPDYSLPTLQHLFGLWHRLHVASKLATLIADHTTQEVFLKNTPAKRRDFESQHRRMQKRLMPLMFTMFHFFERYRQLHQEHLRNEKAQVIDQITRVISIERDIMDGYDDRTLLRLHEVFPLILSTFSRQLRPIAPPYRSRLAVSGCGVKRTDTPAIGLVAEEQAREADAISCRHSECTHSACTNSLNPGSCQHTSPTAGMPSKPLSMDELLPLLAEHQSLQDIWCTTAEEVILERRVVESSTQIKRNTQVLLDLIKEEGSERDEEWEPGLHVEHTATTGYDGMRDFGTNFL